MHIQVLLAPLGFPPMDENLHDNATMERKLAEQELRIQHATKRVEEVEVERDKIVERLHATQKELKITTRTR